MKEDHTAAVTGARPHSFDAVVEAAVANASRSVEKSEQIVANGAKALSFFFQADRGQRGQGQGALFFSNSDLPVDYRAMKRIGDHSLGGNQRVCFVQGFI